MAAQDTETNRKTLNVKEFTESQPKLISSEKSLPSLGLEDPVRVNTNPILIPKGAHGKRNSLPCQNPILMAGSGSPKSGFAGLLGLPSPIITRRNRTPSTYERALNNPIEKGKIRYFCRTKGHGFIVNDRGGEDIFVHVSDIEGEYVPLEGDVVSYRLCPIPPKLEKSQAIHVQIIHFAPDVHIRWDAPVEEVEKADGECTSAPDNLVT